jgi:hypothetical protein
MGRAVASSIRGSCWSLDGPLAIATGEQRAAVDAIPSGDAVQLFGGGFGITEQRGVNGVDAAGLRQKVHVEDVPCQ